MYVVLEEGWGLVFIFFIFLSVKTPNVNSSIYITKYLGGLLYLSIMVTLFLKLNIFVIPRIFISLWKWVSLVETFTHLNDKASLPLLQCITLLLKLPSNTLHLRRHSNPVREEAVLFMKKYKHREDLGFLPDGTLTGKKTGFTLILIRDVHSCVIPFWVLGCRTLWSLCVKGTVEVRRQTSQGCWALPWITESRGMGQESQLSDPETSVEGLRLYF